MSLRGAQRRGNLKAEGMASRGEARCPCETDFKHFGNKNGRFYCKTYHFCVIARPQRGRGNLKVIDMDSRSEARERTTTTKSRNSESSRSDTTAALLRKRHFTRANACISRARYLSHDQRSYFTAKPCRASFRDAVSFRQRLPRRAQKMRPPRNDKSDRVCWNTKRFSERNV